MTLTMQLRLVLVVTGALLMLIIYLLGRRRPVDVVEGSVLADLAPEPLVQDEQFDEPSYLRRAAKQGDARQNEGILVVHREEALVLPPVYIQPTDHLAADHIPDLPMANESMAVHAPDITEAELEDWPAVELASMAESKPLPLSGEPAVVAAHPPPALMVLRVAIPNRISGQALLPILLDEQLVHGRFDIFHRQRDEEIIFSVASINEPGSFDLETMPTHSYSGLSLFAKIPNPLPAPAAFDAMLACAQRLADRSAGLLQDDTGTELLELGIQRLREKAQSLQRV